MPLWTILAKWPAPTGPAWTNPSSRGPGGRSVSKIGIARSHVGVAAADHQAVALLQTPDATRYARRR